MSFWIYKKDSEGKKHWWVIDIEPLFIVMIVSLLLAVVGPTLIFSLPFCLIFIGFILLVISKVSLFHKGIWFSFGTALMTRKYARLYKLAYVFMGIGIFFLILLILKTT